MQIPVLKSLKLKITILNKAGGKFYKTQNPNHLGDKRNMWGKQQWLYLF